MKILMTFFHAPKSDLLGEFGRESKLESVGKEIKLECGGSENGSYLGLPGGTW